jgi:hypothetical protein
VEKMTVGLDKLRDEELHSLHSLPNNVSVT